MLNLKQKENFNYFFYITKAEEVTSEEQKSQ